MVSGNKVLKRILGPKRNKAPGWRKKKEELHILYSTLNVITVEKTLGGWPRERPWEVKKGEAVPVL